MSIPLLVNKQHPLSHCYLPGELVKDPVSGKWIRKEVYQAFSDMNQRAQAEGLTALILMSGYRSYHYQQEVFNRKVNKLIQEGLGKEQATKKAQTIVAIPGTSEHQTGLAIDITNADLAKGQDPLIEAFAQTDHGRWLDKHAHEYGFILRYPKDKVSLTHISYEPWHYRFVGANHAGQIKKLKICLEEYILYLNKNNI